MNPSQNPSSIPIRSFQEILEIKERALLQEQGSHPELINYLIRYFDSLSQTILTTYKHFPELNKWAVRQLFTKKVWEEKHLNSEHEKEFESCKQKNSCLDPLALRIHLWNLAEELNKKEAGYACDSLLLVGDHIINQRKYAENRWLDRCYIHATPEHRAQCRKDIHPDKIHDLDLWTIVLQISRQRFYRPSIAMNKECKEHHGSLERVECFAWREVAVQAEALLEAEASEKFETDIQLCASMVKILFLIERCKMRYFNTGIEKQFESPRIPGNESSTIESFSLLEEELKEIEFPWESTDALLASAKRQPVPALRKSFGGMESHLCWKQFAEDWYELSDVLKDYIDHLAEKNRSRADNLAKFSQPLFSESPNQKNLTPKLDSPRRRSGTNSSSPRNSRELSPRVLSPKGSYLSALGNSPRRVSIFDVEDLVMFGEKAFRISEKVGDIFEVYESKLAPVKVPVKNVPVSTPLPIIDFGHQHAEKIHKSYDELLTLIHQVIQQYILLFDTQAPALPLELYLEEIKKKDDETFTKRILPQIQSEKQQTKDLDSLARRIIQVQKSLCKELGFLGGPLIAADLETPIPFLSLQKLLREHYSGKPCSISIEAFEKEIRRYTLQDGLRIHVGYGTHLPESVNSSPRAKLWQEAFQFLTTQVKNIHKKIFIIETRPYASQPRKFKELDQSDLLILFVNNLSTITTKLEEVHKLNPQCFGKTNTHQVLLGSKRMKELYKEVDALSKACSALKAEDIQNRWESLLSEQNKALSEKRTTQYYLYLNLRGAVESLLQSLENIHVLNGHMIDFSDAKSKNEKGLSKAKIIEDYAPSMRIDQQQLRETLQDLFDVFKNLTSILWSLPPGSAGKR